MDSAIHASAASLTMLSFPYGQPGKCNWFKMQQPDGCQGLANGKASCLHRLPVRFQTFMAAELSLYLSLWASYNPQVATFCLPP